MRALSPSELLAGITQLQRDADEAHRLAAWDHSAVCGDLLNFGVWEPGAVCRGCRFEVRHRENITQYLLVPVKATPTTRDNAT